MAGSLILGAVGLVFVRMYPRAIASIFGVFLLAAGAWNAFWYGLQHFGEHWGQMAFWSGCVMLFSGALCLRIHSPAAQKPSLVLIPILVVLMAGFGAYYAWTIYHL